MTKNTEHMKGSRMRNEISTLETSQSHLRPLGGSRKSTCSGLLDELAEGKDLATKSIPLFGDESGGPQRAGCSEAFH